MTNETELNATVELAGRLGGINVSEYGLNHPYYLLAAVPLMALIIWYVQKEGLSRGRTAFTLVRLTVVLLAVTAIASPVKYSSSTEVKEFPPIFVLSDVSGSMHLFNSSRELSLNVLNDITSTVGNLSGKTENIELDSFSQGNSTAIGDALYRNLVKSEGGSSLMVLISDGINNEGRDPVDVAKAAKAANSTIYVVRPVQSGQDVYLKYVLGDKKIPSNSEYDLLIGVGNTGFTEVGYDLEVTVDGVRRFNRRFSQQEFEKQVQLQLRFDNPGIYQIKVGLNPEKDTITANNVYYKALEVVDKPSILVVTSNATSPLTKVLTRLYNVDIKRDVNVEYSPYTAVFLDNIHSSQLDRNRVNKLREYVLKGNGLVVAGGKNSYEYGAYNNSFIENLLPVKSTEKPEELRKKIAVVFLIDISESTEYGMGKDSKIDIEKAIALNMIRNLDDNDTVGVIAFDTLPYAVSGMTDLGPKRAEVEDRILRLRFTGGTDMVPAFESATKMLKGYSIPKYVIVLSDGVVARSKAPIIFSKVAGLKESDVTVYSVGVGFDTDAQLMAEIARAGGGIYFQPEDYQRLKVEFGEKLEEDNPERVPVVVQDQHHFITRSLAGWNDERPATKGFNKVYEKSVAQVPLSTKGGRPVLAVWRFGLGRVASLMIDNGLVWGQDVYAARNGKMVSSMANWIIGDLEKNKKVRITSSDIHLGEAVVADVKSKDKPDIQLQGGSIGAGPRVSVTRTGVEAYAASFKPDDTGFYGIKASTRDGQDLDAVAVNYPREYLTIGLDEGVLSRIAYVTDGRIYDASQIRELEEELVRKARTAATHEVKQERQLWLYFAAAALALYFLDAVIRRFIDIIRMSRTPKDDVSRPRSQLRRV